MLRSRFWPVCSIGGERGAAASALTAPGRRLQAGCGPGRRRRNRTQSSSSSRRIGGRPCSRRRSRLPLGCAYTLSLYTWPLRPTKQAADCTRCSLSVPLLAACPQPVPLRHPSLSLVASPSELSFNVAPPRRHLSSPLTPPPRPLRSPPPAATSWRRPRGSSTSSRCVIGSPIGNPR